MTTNAWIQIGLYLAAVLLLAKPLGVYMARVFEGKSLGPMNALRPVERALYRVSGIDPEREMDWKTYAAAMLAFSAVGLFVVYGMLRLQHLLPFNPDHLGPVSPGSSFNTSVSFVTNTNWQGYGGETTMSYLSQMAGLAVQNFVSAAAGIAMLIALIRGFARNSASTIGNFWSDLVKTTVFILLPLSGVLALLLVSQGVVQTLAGHATAVPLDASAGQATQTIAVGPAASQIAIKQLGTNGGGFFNVNSSHPFENATPLSNFFEMLAILLIGAALCYTFGRMVGDTRQGWAILAAMAIIFAAFLVVCAASEQAGNPALRHLGADDAASALQAGGNMEGKEARFGIANSAIWATATTAASNGSVDSMHDSFTGLGGLVPLLMMELGEVVFGGVGSGLYGMLLLVIIAVFLAGLMVGRTPEYIGKKLDAYDMKMASLGILVMPLLVLVGTAVAVSTAAGKATIFNPGTHGFSEVLYAFSSAGNNNGSAFAGLGANTPFYNIALGIAMFGARFWIAVPVLALAGSLARKKHVPPSSGTLPTHGATFVTLLVGVVLLVAALTFVPALALGPIAEHLAMLR